jgi:IPTL-CTERM motif
VRRILACSLFALFAAQLVSAEVTLTERKTLHQQLAHDAKDKPAHTRGDGSKATGSQALIDSSGLKYFINTNITFSTSNSASGAMSEASYTAAVAATTLNGGTTSSTLNDAFDGYGAICIGQVGNTGPCPEEEGGDRGAKAHARAALPTKGGTPAYTIYNQNGAATTECDGRQIVLPTQTIPVVGGSIQVSRKVFVPANDSFGRWLNIVTNPGATPVSFNLIVGHNLGSDSNTKIVTSSNGNNTAETSDTWINSFQNYSGTTSSDVRLGHVLQGPGAINPVTFINFVDGDDEPYWDYALTLAPGETRIIANFVAGQPSNAAAAAKAAQLVGLPTNATQCLTPAERTAITNFGAVAQPVPTLGRTGLFALGLLLAGFALLVLRRRSATA